MTPQKMIVEEAEDWAVMGPPAEILHEKIGSSVEIPKPKIVAPILQSPVVTLEVNQPDLKTVAEVKPSEAKSENPVPAPEPQKPVTARLDAPNPGDGVSGVAFRGGYTWISDSGLAVFNQQCEALNQFHKKNLQQGLR